MPSTIGQIFIQVAGFQITAVVYRQHCEQQNYPVHSCCGGREFLSIQELQGCAFATVDATSNQMVGNVYLLQSIVQVAYIQI